MKLSMLSGEMILHAETLMAGAGASELSELHSYAASRTNENVEPISYLYSETDLNGIAEMLSLIAEGLLLQGFDEIDGEDSEQIDAVMNPDGVARYIYLLCKFVCLVNPAFCEDDFERVFEASFKWYSDNCIKRLHSFEEDGDLWKYWMRGCLFCK